MGVRRLQYFMENEGGCCYTVNILDLISKNSHEKPVILVDMSACYRPIIHGLPYLSGGQLKEIYDAIEDFVVKFQKAGAELVIFLDGPVCDAKLSVYISRRKAAMPVVTDIFKQINENPNGPIVEKQNDFEVRPSNVLTVSYRVFEKHKCKVIQSIEECDLEIARYAKKHKCFAILSQDTDFVIFNSAKYYLSAKHLTLSKMTTLVYDSHKLAQVLRIRIEELPLLASLIGNDVVSSDSLRHFHIYLNRKLSRSYHMNNMQTFYHVASYINDVTYRNLSIEQIAQHVWLENLVENCQMLKESLASYNTDTDNEIPVYNFGQPWDSVLKMIYEKHANEMLNPQMYATIFLNRTTCSTTLEDYNAIDLPPNQTILRKLRQKIYGILLYEKPLPEGVSKHKITEYVVEGYNSLDDLKTVEAIIPPVPHSGLVAYFTDNGSLKGEKENLFAWALGISKNVLNLDEELIIPIASLKYLLVEGLRLNQWEIEAIVASFVLLKFYNSSQLRQLPLYPLYSRAVRIYTILTRTFATVKWVSNALGSLLQRDKINPINYQDGKLYHKKYREARSGDSMEMLCEGRDILDLTTKLLSFLKAI